MAYSRTTDKEIRDALAQNPELWRNVKAMRQFRSARVLNALGQAYTGRDFMPMQTTVDNTYGDKLRDRALLHQEKIMQILSKIREEDTKTAEGKLKLAQASNELIQALLQSVVDVTTQNVSTQGSVLQEKLRTLKSLFESGSEQLSRFGIHENTQAERAYADFRQWVGQNAEKIKERDPTTMVELGNRISNGLRSTATDDEPIALAFAVNNELRQFGLSMGALGNYLKTGISQGTATAVREGLDTRARDLLDAEEMLTDNRGRLAEITAQGVRLIDATKEVLGKTAGANPLGPAIKTLDVIQQYMAQGFIPDPTTIGETSIIDEDGKEIPISQALYNQAMAAMQTTREILADARPPEQPLTSEADAMRAIAEDPQLQELMRRAAKRGMSMEQFARRLRINQRRMERGWGGPDPRMMDPARYLGPSARTRAASETVPVNPPPSSNPEDIPGNPVTTQTGVGQQTEPTPEEGVTLPSLEDQPTAGTELSQAGGDMGTPWGLIAQKVGGALENMGQAAAEGMKADAASLQANTMAQAQSGARARAILARLNQRRKQQGATGTPPDVLPNEEDVNMVV